MDDSHPELCRGRGKCIRILIMGLRAWGLRNFKARSCHWLDNQWGSDYPFILPTHISSTYTQKNNRWTTDSNHSPDCPAPSQVPPLAILAIQKPQLTQTRRSGAIVGGDGGDIVKVEREDVWLLKLTRGQVQGVETSHFALGKCGPTHLWGLVLLSIKSFLGYE